jgi:pimeloyl-ACP methyl ester carboxylesterase
VLLDPAIIPGGDDRLLALAEDARTRRTYASFEELVDCRMEESFLSLAPRELVADELRHHVEETAEGVWQYRYVQAAVVTVYAELAIPPAPFPEIQAPTLLLKGATSYVPLDGVVPAFSKALGERLEVVTVPGGHTVLWDALPETAAAVAAFLAP